MNRGFPNAVCDEGVGNSVVTPCFFEATFAAGHVCEPRDECETSFMDLLRFVVPTAFQLQRASNHFTVCRNQGPRYRLQNGKDLLLV